MKHLTPSLQTLGARAKEQSIGGGVWEAFRGKRVEFWLLFLEMGISPEFSQRVFCPVFFVKPIRELWGQLWGKNTLIFLFLASVLGDGGFPGSLPNP